MKIIWSHENCGDFNNKNSPDFQTIGVLVRDPRPELPAAWWLLESSPDRPEVDAPCTRNDEIAYIMLSFRQKVKSEK